MWCCKRITGRAGAHNIYMRLSCIICSVILIILGICGGVYAIFGFDLLVFICFYNDLAARTLTALGGVAALFLIYALSVLKPYKGLK